jgi:hypothetical protein
MATFPVYVPGTRFAVLTPIERSAGAVPDVALTVSQFVPEAVVGVAVKFAALPVLVIATVWLAGAPPPVWKLNVKWFELTFTSGSAETTIVTGIASVGLAAPGAVIVTLPVYVPAARVPGSAEIRTAAGVCELTGVAVSQFVPEATEVVKLNPSAAPLLLRTTLCAGGLAPPVRELKTRTRGFTRSVGFGLILRVTGTVRGVLVVPGAVITSELA